MQAHTIITEEDFIERFQPLPNHLNPHASFDFGDGGCLYETHGEELACIRNVKSALVWTITDCDGCLCLISGVHFVNRLGYVIAAIPVLAGKSFSVEFEFVA